MAVLRRIARPSAGDPDVFLDTGGGAVGRAVGLVHAHHPALPGHDLKGDHVGLTEALDQSDAGFVAAHHALQRNLVARGPVHRLGEGVAHRGQLDLHVPERQALVDVRLVLGIGVADEPTLPVEDPSGSGATQLRRQYGPLQVDWARVGRGHPSHDVGQLLGLAEESRFGLVLAQLHNHSAHHHGRHRDDGGGHGDQAQPKAA